MLCNCEFSSIIISILNTTYISNNCLNIYTLVILHLSKGNFSSVYSHFVPLSSAPSLLKFHRKFANLISKITCKLGMGRRNCKHGINVLLGTLFMATTMMRESLNLNSDCIQKQRNFFTIRNFSIILIKF